MKKTKLDHISIRLLILVIVTNPSSTKKFSINIKTPGDTADFDCSDSTKRSLFTIRLQKASSSTPISFNLLSSLSSSQAHYGIFSPGSNCAYHTTRSATSVLFVMLVIGSEGSGQNCKIERIITNTLFTPCTDPALTKPLWDILALSGGSSASPGAGSFTRMTIDSAYVYPKFKRMILEMNDFLISDVNGAGSLDCYSPFTLLTRPTWLAPSPTSPQT